MAKRTRTRTRTTAPKNPEISGGIDRKKFLGVLAKVMPGIADKAVLEQSTHFIFDEDRIWSYNDEVSISHKFKTGVKGALVAKKLFKLCSKLEEDNIEINQTTSGVVIRGESFETSLAMDAEIKLKKITVPGTNSKKWIKLPSDFIDGVNLCFFSASTNMVKPELTCLFVTGDNIYSTDTYRGTKYIMEEEFDGAFIIPARIATKLKNYNPVKVLEENNWLHFINNEGTVFSCRTYDAVYPADLVKRAFNTEGEKITLPESFAKVVERASILVSEDFALDRMVTISVSSGEIVCSGKGIDGWYREKKEIDYVGKEIDVKAQPEFLNQILHQLNDVTIGKAQLLFEGDKFEHFMRLSG